MSWVDVVEQYQRPKQHLPVFSEQVLQAVPVDLFVGTVDDVGDIGAVEAFPARYEHLGCDEFLGSQHFDAHAELFTEVGAVDPALVYDDSGIAHPGNEVDEVFSAM